MRCRNEAPCHVQAISHLLLPLGARVLRVSARLIRAVIDAGYENIPTFYFSFVNKATWSSEVGGNPRGEYSAPPRGCSAAPFALIYLRRCVQTHGALLQLAANAGHESSLSAVSTAGIVVTCANCAQIFSLAQATRRDRAATAFPGLFRPSSNPNPFAPPPHF